MWFITVKLLNSFEFFGPNRSRKAPNECHFSCGVYRLPIPKCSARCQPQYGGLNWTNINALKEYVHITDIYL